MNVSLPVEGDATRGSVTNSSGGTDETVTPSANESKIDEAALYFCTKDETTNEYTLLFSLETSATGGEAGGPNYALTENKTTDATYTHKLEVEVPIGNIKKLLGKTVYLFLVANHNKVSGYTISDSSGPENAKFNSSSSAGWPVYLEYGDSKDTNGNGLGQVLPLVNYEEFKIEGFKDIDSNLTTNADVFEAVKNMFNKVPSFSRGVMYEVPNVLELERGVARVDFKCIPQDGITQDYTYKIKDTNFYIQLGELQMVNLNSEAYLFRHTIKGSKLSAYGESGETVSIFGKENGDDTGSYYNWVVGTDWTDTPSKSGAGLKNTLKMEEGVLSQGTGFDLTLANIEMDELAKFPVYDTDNYHPWCYIYENTIPTVDMMTDEERYKYATGLIFKFKVLGKPQTTEDEGNKVTTYPVLKLTDDVTDYPDGITKCTDKGVKDGTITMTKPDGTWMNVEPDNKGVYWLEYYAFIPHNNDDDTEEETTTEVTHPETGETVTSSTTVTYKAPMKYGIVRNNVYQLSINSVTDLPNPEEPRTLYLQIDCTVLNWNVRWDDDITLF